VSAGLSLEEQILVGYDPTIRPSEILNPNAIAPAEKIAVSMRVTNLYEVRQDESLFEIGFTCVELWYDSRLEFND
jgi:hypothetical protein